MGTEESGFESYLAGHFAARKRRNAAYSLRAFARDLGISPSYLSLVLSRKRAMPPPRVAQLARKLRASEEQLRGFVAAAVRIPRAAPDRPRRYRGMSDDRYRLLNEWFHLPLLDLTLTRGFRSDPAWVARRLGVTALEVRRAVRRLLRLGLLVEEGGAWRKTDAYIAFPTTRSRSAVRRYQRQMIGKSLKALDSSRRSDFAGRDITGITMPIDTRRLPEARERIRRFRRSLCAFLSQGECDGLYQLNVQLFSLLETPKHETRGRKNEPRKARRAHRGDGGARPGILR